jgi:hypothetical protein
VAHLALAMGAVALITKIFLLCLSVASLGKMFPKNAIAKPKVISSMAFK